MTCLIRNGRLLDPTSGTDKPADLMIEHGRVTQIATASTLDCPDQTEVIDATGKWVTPGLVDVHVHLREPGEEYKEDIASGAAAAAAGGFTSIVAMPNTKPALHSGELVKFVRDRGVAAGLTRVLSSGAITMDLKGERLAPFGEMREAGAVGFTDDGRPVADARLMRAALEYSQDYGVPILTHAEDCCLSRGGHMHEGAVSTRLGIGGIPRVAEDTIVARDIMLAEYTGGRLHICHVSTAASVELIRQAQARGVKVTGEAAPHHFVLTHEAVEGFATDAKMYPPLREEMDRQGIVAGLKDGTLCAIATDHAPHSTLEKDVAFSEAANGIIGLQTALPLSLDLHRVEGMPLLDVIHRMTAGPCEALSLPYGTLLVGAVADVTVVDPKAEWVFDRAAVKSKSANSPFLGRTLKGRATHTLVAGRVVYRQG